MKYTIVAIIISLTILANPVRPAFAADKADSDSQKKTVMELIVEKVMKFINSSPAEASNSSEAILNGDKAELLKILNKAEHKIRVGVSGRDLYLKRDGILPEIDDFIAFIEKSDITDENKKVLISELSDVRKAYLLDLVDSPQEKIKSEVLSMFNSYQVLVFQLNDQEAYLLLSYFESKHIDL